MPLFHVTNLTKIILKKLIKLDFKLYYIPCFPCMASSSPGLCWLCFSALSRACVCI